MRRYVRAFFRHPILLILPIVAALVISVQYTMGQPRTYQASLSFWCDTAVPNPSSFVSGNGAAPAASQQVVLNELLHTRTFLTRVGRAGPWAGYLDTHSPADNDMLLFKLAGDVSVSTAGPHVLAVSTLGKSPERALALARAVSTAYIGEANDTLQARAKSSVGFYQLQVDEAAKALAEARAKYTQYLQVSQGTGPLGALGDATAAQLTQQVSAAQANYDRAKLNTDSAALGLSSVADSGVMRVFDQPTASPLPVSRKKKIVFAGVAGLFGGVMISFATLLLLVLGDRSVQAAGDIESIPGMQVVGTVEQFRSKRRRTKKVKKAS